MFNLESVKPNTQQTEREIPESRGTCDMCGVGAPFVAHKGSSELYFCGHHVRRHAEGLLEKGFQIIPDTYTLS